MFGNYGAEGNFKNASEETFASSVFSIGLVSLLFTSISAGFVVWREMKRQKQTNQSIATPIVDVGEVTEASEFWFVISFIGTFTQATFAILTAVTMSQISNSIMQLILPFATLLFIGSFFS